MSLEEFQFGADHSPYSNCSVVVGADSSSPVTGVRADLLSAAYNAVEAGLRGAKVSMVKGLQNPLMFFACTDRSEARTGKSQTILPEY